MKIDWKLKGNNLLRFGCGKDVTVHPETCSKMVLMNCNEDKSLYDWITNDGESTLGTSLSNWLVSNPPYTTATKDNPSGLLKISNQISNVSGGTIVEDSEATNPLIAPVRYEEDTKLHGIVLNDIIANEAFITALAQALASTLASTMASTINSDSDLRATWREALNITSLI